MPFWCPQNHSLRFLSFSCLWWVSYLAFQLNIAPLLAVRELLADLHQQSCKSSIRTPLKFNGCGEQLWSTAGRQNAASSLRAFNADIAIANLPHSLAPVASPVFSSTYIKLSHCRHSASVSRLSSSWSPILMSYSELKHCRLLTFHSRLFVFVFFFSFLTLPRSSSATIGFTD